MTKFAAIMALAASASALKLSDNDIDIGLNDGAHIENYRENIDQFGINDVKLEIERHDVAKGKDEHTQPLCAIGGQ